jgi:hypothetical protein
MDKDRTELGTRWHASQRIVPIFYPPERSLQWLNTRATPCQRQNYRCLRARCPRRSTTKVFIGAAQLLSSVTTLFVDVLPCARAW